MNDYNIKRSRKSRMREGYLKDSRLCYTWKNYGNGLTKVKEGVNISIIGPFVEQPFVINVNINNLEGLNTSKMTKTHA